MRKPGSSGSLERPWVPWPTPKEGSRLWSCVSVSVGPAPNENMGPPRVVPCQEVNASPRPPTNKQLLLPGTLVFLLFSMSHCLYNCRGCPDFSFFIQCFLACAVTVLYTTSRRPHVPRVAHVTSESPHPNPQSAHPHPAETC